MLTNQDRSYLKDKYRKMSKYTGVRLSDSEISGRLSEIESLIKVNERPTTYKSNSGSGFGINFGETALLNNNSGWKKFPILARDSAEADALAMVLRDDAQVPAYNIPSSGVPQPATTIYVSQPIKEIYKATRLKDLASDYQQGVFGVTDVKIPVRVTGGVSSLYDDLSTGGNSTVNYNWVPRQVQYWEQSLIYGDMQQAIFSLAKLDYVSDVRDAMAISIAQQQNDIGFNGWSGSGKNAVYFSIYGILNEPNLPPAITLPADGQIPGDQSLAPTSKWIGKNYYQITRDILLLVNDVLTRLVGHMSLKDVKGTLSIPPSANAWLGYTNTVGQTVAEWISSTLPGLRLVTTSNFETTLTSVTNSVIMLAVNHPQTGEKPFRELFVTKYQAHRPFVQSTAVIEKVSYGLGGVVCVYPICVSYAYGV